MRYSDYDSSFRNASCVSIREDSPEFVKLLEEARWKREHGVLESGVDALIKEVIDSFIKVNKIIRN